MAGAASYLAKLSEAFYAEPFTPTSDWLEGQYNGRPLLSIDHHVKATEQYSPDEIDLGRYFTFCGYYAQRRVAFFWIMPHSSDEDVLSHAREVVGANASDLQKRLEFEMGFVLVPMPDEPQERVLATLLFPYRPSLLEYRKIVLTSEIQEQLIAAMDE